jgi:hypothetical protein
MTAVYACARIISLDYLARPSNAERVEDFPSRETLEKSPHSRDNALVIEVRAGFMGGKQLGFGVYE